MHCIGSTAKGILSEMFGKTHKAMSKGERVYTCLFVCVSVCVWCAHGDVTKACSLMAAMTSLKRIFDVSVWPWKMTGSPSSPSQQSTACGGRERDFSRL